MNKTPSNSIQGETVASPQIASSQSASDSSRLLTVFGVLAVLFFLTFATFAWFTIEVLSWQSPPGHVVVDHEELRRAQDQLQVSNEQVKDFEKQFTELADRIQALRKSRVDQKGTPMSLTNVAKRPLVLFPQPTGLLTKLPKPSHASNLYTRLVMIKSNWRNLPSINIGSSDDEIRSQFSKLVIDGIAVGQLEPLLGLLAIERLGDDSSKTTIIRLVLSDSNLMEVASAHGQRDLLMVAMVRLCAFLPPKERSVAVQAIGSNFVKFAPSFDSSVKKLVQDWTGKERADLARWLVHPSSEIRQLADELISDEVKWDTMLGMLEGKDYRDFVLAVRWISKQDVQDQHRQRLLKSLGSVLLVSDVVRPRVVENYCNWADSTSAETITHYLAIPGLGPKVALPLIDAAVRLKLPMVDAVDNSQGIVSQELLRRYVAGDETVSLAFRELLESDPPKDSAIRWIKIISREGGPKQVGDVQQGVELLRKSLPDALMTHQATKYLTDMKQRLRTQ